MLTIMCAACPELALTLLKQCIADTLCYLLTGSAEKNSHFEVCSLSWIIAIQNPLLVVYLNYSCFSRLNWFLAVHKSCTK